MKVKILHGLTVLAVLAGMLNPTEATAQTVERDLSDFLDAQGTFDFSGILFVPPVPNFFGFTDGDPETMVMSVDYAGLADATCGGIAETVFKGEVKETLMPDGRALVSVELETFNAITWVSSAEGVVLFGTRWEDDDGVCVFDDSPTLGESELKVSFYIPEPGAPLPDMIAFAVQDLDLDGYEDQIPEGLELVSLDFEAKAFETLADGATVKAETKQVSKVIDGEWKFSVEVIELE
jgi:hypothetical protein